MRPRSGSPGRPWIPSRITLANFIPLTHCCWKVRFKLRNRSDWSKVLMCSRMRVRRQSATPLTAWPCPLTSAKPTRASRPWLHTER